MTKASVVIGANWGDEGKGLMTDYLCRKHNADLVIRFNGGAQAGHTVVTPEGNRHVFRHIGSGYYAGISTYLSEYFILNPIIFKKEYESLNIPSTYNIYISPLCEMTTYWDMLANRVMEEWRGANAHGSCGVGINTTLDRANNFQHIRFTDIEKDHFCDQLSAIAEYWYNQLKFLQNNCRLPAPEMPQWALDCFERERTANERFIQDCKYFYSKTELIYGMKFLKQFEYGVFEGAQGLALDQFYGNYPYVTRSNTGMRNVLELQRKNDYIGKGNFEIDEIVYVSRTYETRHGNDSSFVGETMPEKVKDETNIPNAWQGELRYRKLSYQELGRRIALDIYANNLRDYAPEEKIKLALTHRDQIKIDYGRLFHLVGSETNNIITEALYQSSGETYKDVEYTSNEV
jgi:adenylosuccinate synthase